MSCCASCPGLPVSTASPSASRRAASARLQPQRSGVRREPATWRSCGASSFTVYRVNYQNTDQVVLGLP